MLLLRHAVLFALSVPLYASELFPCTNTNIPSAQQLTFFSNHNAFSVFQQWTDVSFGQCLMYQLTDTSTWSSTTNPFWMRQTYADWVAPPPPSPPPPPVAGLGPGAVAGGACVFV